MGYDIAPELERFKNVLTDADKETIEKRGSRTYIEDKLSKASIDQIVQVLRFTTPYEWYVRPFQTKLDKDREMERERILSLLKTKVNNQSKAGKLSEEEKVLVEEVLPGFEPERSKKATINSLIDEIQALPKSERAAAMKDRLQGMDRQDAKQIRIAVNQDLSPTMRQLNEKDGPDFISVFKRSYKTANDEERRKMVARLRRKFKDARSSDNKRLYKQLIDDVGRLRDGKTEPQ